MAERRRISGAGRAWLLLIWIPPALVVAGLAALFVWQGAKGGIVPKWKKNTSTSTNTVAESPAPRR